MEGRRRRGVEGWRGSDGGERESRREGLNEEGKERDGGRGRRVEREREEREETEREREETEREREETEREREETEREREESGEGGTAGRNG